MGDTGTYALAEVKDQQENVRRSLYFGKSVCDLINEHIVRRIVDTVWGPQEHYPELTFSLGSETKDPDRLSKVIQAVQAGVLELTTGDKNQIREEFGFDPIAIEEGIRQREEFHNFHHGGEDHTLNAFKAWASLPKYRNQSLTLSKKDVTELGGHLDKIEAKAAKDSQKIIKKMRDDYVSRSEGITDRMELRGITTSLTNTYQPFLRQVIQPSVSRMIDLGSSSVLYELGVTDKIARATPDTTAPFGSNSFAAAEADRISTHIINVNSAYLENNAVKELDENTRNRTKPPLQKVSATKKVIAGYSGRSLNEGRNVIIKAIQNEATKRGIKDTRVIAEYSSVLETNTCDPCRDADGERAVVGSVKYNRLNPPNRCEGGDRCRCFWSYILPSEAGYQEILDSLR